MSKETITREAIKSVTGSKLAFSKFITANDVGSTGGHQSGFHLPKGAYPLYFDEPGQKGENKEHFVKIKWHGGLETDSRFIYYGQGTRNEYRLTRFGRDFPFLHEDNVGDLLVLAKYDTDYYEGFVLSSDEAIEYFLTAFGLSSEDTNKLIPRGGPVQSTDSVISALMEAYISQLHVDFPPTHEVAVMARNIVLKAYGKTNDDILQDPDKEILQWIETEYKLFKAIENSRYASLITHPFNTVEDLIQTANSILNRRKSRAGKSLEHHLAEIFTAAGIKYSDQAVTEENKKPDFIFPGIEEYRDAKYPENKLIFLGAKTTCKDRWRQIINEADRIKIKYLFTLQQGISANQLREIYKHDVRLVVPKRYLTAFPKEHRTELITLHTFISHVQDTQRV
jgi:type II restriction enzyme